MTSFFQPPPEVLAFLFLKNFLYLEVLAVLALFRVILGEGLARYPAALALALASAGILTTFAPALGWDQGAVYVSASRLLSGNGGMSALLVPTVLFAISGVLPRARWRWLDVLHGLILAVLLGLWWWTS
ncbi:MAG: hypothetical protein N4A70_03015 [Pelagimonas sp.]|jgi:hypothetical protein|nr:hypothetical protein [Pelagimonas sp.]